MKTLIMSAFLMKVIFFCSIALAKDFEKTNCRFKLSKKNFEIALEKTENPYRDLKVIGAGPDSGTYRVGVSGCLAEGCTESETETYATSSGSVVLIVTESRINGKFKGAEFSCKQWK